ncbi:TonB C-terminal domain-containing protein [Rhodopseudomonas palustris]|uniref:TonB C-terminal domain-containing protein n=1 Tax=Rhodopseudomonas palustris TaxID=1076 RepID=UPI000675BDC2|nr:TonB C-terminal domain-containing protein [Rhodopseudomonas palustris]
MRFQILVVLWGAIVFAAPSATAADPHVEFNIPAQSLDGVLDAFGTATGSIAVYNGNLTIGLRSQGLKGRFTPAEALKRLLLHTGLIGEYTNDNAFVVLAVPSSAASLATASAIAQAALSQQNVDEQRYSGLLQETVVRALCLRPETQTGGYRAVISFSVDASGEVVRPRLLSSTGDQRLDAAIPETLGGIVVGRLPPPRMAQPFTMIVLPQTTSTAGFCPPRLARGSRDE